ncbi:MAG: ferredoxin family protein [Muribaculum sp.]|nr:ferredoxin family protein [Muribaculum sp.]
MSIFKTIRNRMETDFISINPHNCIACWECYAVCPRNVFGKVVFFGHRHIRIQNADDCIGCKKCVRVCRHNAIQPKS